MKAKIKSSPENPTQSWVLSKGKKTLYCDSYHSAINALDDKSVMENTEDM